MVTRGGDFPFKNGALSGGQNGAGLVNGRHLDQPGQARSRFNARVIMRSGQGKAGGEGENDHGSGDYTLRVDLRFTALPANSKSTASANAIRASSRS